MTALLHASQELYDLIVIGGGINGAAIARDAALRNLKVVLLEKSDFGAGASSKTSKLAHGGIRYLEKLHIGLVKESLTERGLLLANAPHLVKPLPFIMPVYASNPHALWKVHFGLYFYDFLAYNNGLPRHKKLNANQVLSEVEGLKASALNGGCVYYDAQMQDSRIVIENILSAEQAGVRVYNYTEVTRLIKVDKKIKGVSFINKLTGEEGQFYAKVVVNATGAWSGIIGEMEPDAIHCRPAPSKGVHLILPKIISKKALLLHVPKDGRVFFVLPWGEKYSLVGTTDTFYDGNPDELKVTNEDKAYLLNALNVYFPEMQLTESSIIASFVGLRPLVASEKKLPVSDVAREHVIQTSTGGLITILGGKFTTHRLIAEEVVDQVIERLPKEKRFLACSTRSSPLPGAGGIYTLTETMSILQAAGIKQELQNHLVNTYGTASVKILEIIKKNPQGLIKVNKFWPHVYAEFIYSIKNEHVKSFDDWLMRCGLVNGS
jgi:glycerol-3-phosphate dehydrogenase